MRNPIDVLSEAGAALYGPRWQSELARDLDLSDRHMRRMVAGAAVSPTILRSVLALCETRRSLLLTVAKELKRTCRSME